MVQRRNLWENTFILLCVIFLFNQVAQINRSMYKSDIEEDEEGRVIDVILYVNVHGLKFEIGKRCPQQSCICPCLVLCSEQSQSNQTHWNGSECKLSKLRQHKWQATIINYINISNPSHIQSTDVFPKPNVISIPSLETLGFVLDGSMAGCWFCRIRDPLTGAVLRASGKKDSRNEDRDASLGVFRGFFLT